MTALKKKVPHSIISCFFLMYFVILFAERLQSLIRAATADQLFMDAFEGAASMIVSRDPRFGNDPHGIHHPGHTICFLRYADRRYDLARDSTYAQEQKPFRTVVFADLPYRLFDGDTGSLQALHADERDFVSRY